MTKNKLYKIQAKYPKLSLEEERQLIAKAQQGSTKCIDEIVMRHIGFVTFRIRRKVFPELLKRFAEDLLSDAILILYEKIKTYNLHYRDKRGKPKPVKFITYIWKRIDGHIIDSLKKELRKDKKERREALHSDIVDEMFL